MNAGLLLAIVVGTAHAGDESLQLAVVPGVGVHAAPATAVDGLSVGVLGARAERVDGLAVGTLSHRVDGSLDGLQVAWVVTTAGEARDGVQLSGLAALSGDVAYQGSGVAAVSTGMVNGAQLGGMVAVAREVEGLQSAGLVAVSSGEVRGAQLATIASVSEEIDGLQMSLVNVGGHVDGAQIGLINVAREVDGVSIGLLNFIGNGRFRVDAWASEAATANLGVKFGGQVFYTLLGAGWVRPDDSWWTFGGGLGAHIPAGAAWVDMDVSGWGVADGRFLADGGALRGRLITGLQLAPRFAPFVGITGHLWFGGGELEPFVRGIPHSRSERGAVVAWPGFVAGLQI